MPMYHCTIYKKVFIVYIWQLHGKLMSCYHSDIFKLASKSIFDSQHQRVSGQYVCMYVKFTQCYRASYWKR